MKKYFSIFFLLLAIRPCAAQWQPDSGLGPYQVLAFGAVDTNFFVSLANVQFPFGDSNALVRRTPGHVDRHDEGTSVYSWNGWTQCDANHELIEATSIASLGRYIFAAGDGGIVRTTDVGQNWVGVGKDSLGHWINGGSSLGVIGSTLLSGGYRSTDSGAIGTWRRDSATTNYTSMVTIGPYVIGGASNGIWRSTDSGLHWTVTSNLISSSFAIIGTTVFSAGAGLLRSTDSGKTWNDVTGLTFGGLANSVATDGKNLFVGTYDTGVVVSTDLGASWRAVNVGIRNNGSNYWVGSIAVFEDSLLYANFSGSRGNPNMHDWSTWHRAISEMVDTTEGVVEQTPQPRDSIEIYPNPANGLVSILAGNTSILGVSVLNVLGEDLLNLSNERASDITLDLSKLPSGTYFLRIETAQGSALRKIVINR